MAELAYQRARKEAQDVRRISDPGTHGVDGLIAIAQTWGAIVYFEPLEEDISGFIIKHEHDSSARIYVNSLDSPERQRFTLAHEIGHLVERRSIANDHEYSFTDFRDNGAGYDLHEFFADEFAGELLMPPFDLIREYRSNGPYAAARRFGVSVPAIEKRLGRLRKHPPE